jgi:Bor protein
MSSIRGAVSLVLLAMTACGYTYHYRNLNVPRGEEHDQWASFFLFGIVGHYELDVREFCQGEVAEITSGTNFLTWLVSTLTLGIYSPRKVNIWCAGAQGTLQGGERFEIQFDASDTPTRVVRWAGGHAWSGMVRGVGHTADRRYAVLLEEAR